MLYFVAIVGLGVAALIGFIVASGRKSRDGRQSRKTARHHEPLYEARHVHEPLHHQHSHTPDSSNAHVWHNRRSRMLDESWGSKTISATRLRSDEEPAASEEETDGPLMTEVQYTPVEVPKASNQKS